MKRLKLVNHLLKSGCVFVREGSKHSLYFNPATKRLSTIPRHSEINNFLARKICRDLGVQECK
ncbi:MAG: type II toxin-antitoxin system HicA family toxin [Patescibacteria group bacterium]